MLCLFSYLVDGSCTKIPALHAGTQTPSSVFFGHSKGVVCDRVGGLCCTTYFLTWLNFWAIKIFIFGHQSLCFVFYPKVIVYERRSKKSVLFHFVFLWKISPNLLFFRRHIQKRWKITILRKNRFCYRNMLKLKCHSYSISTWFLDVHWVVLRYNLEKKLRL